MTLPEVLTEDLVAELKRRYSLLIVAGSADLSLDCRAEILSFQGPILSLMGLTDVAYEDLVEQYKDFAHNAEDIP